MKEMLSPGFEKYHFSKIFACGGLLFFVFAYLMGQFSKIVHLDIPFFALLDHYSWNSGGSVKILSKIFLLKGGLAKFRNSVGTFCHQATTKIQGGLDSRPSYDICERNNLFLCLTVVPLGILQNLGAGVRA